MAALSDSRVVASLIEAIREVSLSCAASEGARGKSTADVKKAG